MTLQLHAFLEKLAKNPEAPVLFLLPDGDLIPNHFHVTEVGRVRKDFIDCGGTVRSSTHCLLQTWVADDTDHRLKAGKLLSILKLAAPLLGGEDLPVEVEYEGHSISQYPLAGFEVTPAGLLFHLQGKHTACLAPDKCGVPVNNPGSLEVGSCCGPKGCC